MIIKSDTLKASSFKKYIWLGGLLERMMNNDIQCRVLFFFLQKIGVDANQEKKIVNYQLC